MKTLDLGSAKAGRAKPQWQLAERIASLIFHRRQCAHCRSYTLRPVRDAAAVHALLSATQALEELIGSVRYVLWKCSHCTAIDLEEKPVRGIYSACPDCGVRAGRERITLVALPTRYAAGRRLVVRDCAYCHTHHSTFEEIPRVVVPGSVHRPGDYG
jgi:hypothetical protein